MSNLSTEELLKQQELEIAKIKEANKPKILKMLNEGTFDWADISFQIPVSYPELMYDDEMLKKYKILENYDWDQYFWGIAREIDPDRFKHDITPYLLEKATFVSVVGDGNYDLTPENYKKWIKKISHILPKLKGYDQATMETMMQNHPDLAIYIFEQNN
jgi:hypothetical protein